MPSNPAPVYGTQPQVPTFTPMELEAMRFIGITPEMAIQNKIDEQMAAQQAEEFKQAVNAQPINYNFGLRSAMPTAGGMWSTTPITAPSGGFYSNYLNQKNLRDAVNTIPAPVVQPTTPKPLYGGGAYDPTDRANFTGKVRQF
jgi:hypothetical protein